jgi:hypothetical protein
MQPEDYESEEENPVSYSIDNAILMHRDAHFAGSFPLMLEYYRVEGKKGANPEFELTRIEALYETERKSGKNLSPLLLSGAEAEKVGEALEAYRSLRTLYEDKTTGKLPLLIADLILSEEEDEEKAMEAVITQKSAIVPLLIDLIRSEKFYSPLFPGYGEAPILAAQCLGKIGDKRSLISLFEMLGEGDFFNEDLVLESLYAIGDPAKQFLLKVLQGHPINYDNERAALALIRFKEDPEVSLACLKLLKEIDIKKHTSFATYLVLNCEKLPEKERAEIAQFAKDPNIPKMVQQDLLALEKTWRAEGS